MYIIIYIGLVVNYSNVSTHPKTCTHTSDLDLDARSQWFVRVKNAG